MENLIEEFKRKMILDGKSERTVEVYSNSVKEFFKWFYDSYGNVEFKKLYRENILEYKSYLKNIKKSLHSGNNLCPKSINSKLSALICFNELMEPDNIVVSKRDLIKIQAEIVSPTSITKKEIEEFRQVVLQAEGCAARRNFAIVTILAYAGLRISECLNLRKSDICLEFVEKVQVVLHGLPVFDHSAVPPCNCDGLEYFSITRAHLVTVLRYQMRRTIQIQCQ